MLRIENVSKQYNGHQVLKDVTFQGYPGDVIGIIGQTGSGKTTLLNIISGFEKPDSGDIFIDNVDYKDFCKKDVDLFRNSSVTFLFQNYNLIDELSVFENLKLSLNFRRDRNGKIDEILADIGLLDYKHKLVSKLSGGEKQRIAIARALLKDFDILVCDEPTGNLDETNTKLIYDLIVKTCPSKLVLIVTHKKALSVNYMNKILELNHITHEMSLIKDENGKKEYELLCTKEKSFSLLGVLKHSLNRLKMLKVYNILLTLFICFFMITFSSSIILAGSKYEEVILESETSNYPLYEVDVSSSLDNSKISGHEHIEGINNVYKATSFVKLKSSKYNVISSMNFDSIMVNFYSGESFVSSSLFNGSIEAEYLNTRVVEFQVLNDNLYSKRIIGRYPVSESEVLLDIKTAIQILGDSRYNYAKYLDGMINANEIYNQISDDRLVFFNPSIVVFNTVTNQFEQECKVIEFDIVGIIDSKLLSNYLEGIYIVNNSVGLIEEMIGKPLMFKGKVLSKTDPSEDVHRTVVENLNSTDISDDVLNAFQDSYEKVETLIRYNLFLVIIALIIFIAGLLLLFVHVYSHNVRVIALYRSLGFPIKIVVSILAFSNTILSMVAFSISIVGNSFVISRLLNYNSSLVLISNGLIVYAFILTVVFVILSSSYVIKRGESKPISSFI